MTDPMEQPLQPEEVDSDFEEEEEEEFDEFEADSPRPCPECGEVYNCKHELALLEHCGIYNRECHSMDLFRGVLATEADSIDGLIAELFRAAAEHKKIKMLDLLNPPVNQWEATVEQVRMLCKTNSVRTDDTDAITEAMFETSLHECVHELIDMWIYQIEPGGSMCMWEEEDGPGGSTTFTLWRHNNPESVTKKLGIELRQVAEAIRNIKST